MTKRFQPARRAKIFTGVASISALLAMVAGFEAAPSTDATAAVTPVSRSTTQSPAHPSTSAQAPVAEPAAPAPAEAAPVEPASVAPAVQAPAPAPAPVVVAPPPAPVTPPAATSAGSGG
ncbi:MAG: hypothetical protein KF761_03580 [Salinibacterium sp.]|nr:hypothetical protein [Salinibacterium sp.]